MASCLALKDYAAVVGKTALTDWALQLDTVPVAPSLVTQGGQLRQFNRLADIDASLPLASRLVAMLEKLRAQLSVLPDAAPVLLVLPEQLGSEQALAGFIFTLQQEFPALLSHSACQLFPYGRSAALMALTAARQLLTAGEPVVWIIALDSPVAALSAIEPAVEPAIKPVVSKTLQSETVSAETVSVESAEDKNSGQVVWSEGAVAVALQHSDSGLYCHYLAADATVSNAAEELAIAQLFAAVAANTKRPLERLYLADNGSSALTACWQPHYQRLAPVIAEATQLSFPAYTTGELGAAGGLYRFLHLYLGYINACHSGLTLQCEISERLYRAVAVFSWQQAGSISEF